MMDVMIEKNAKAIESLRKHVRQRKLRIISLAILTVVILGCVAWIISMLYRIDTRMTPEMIGSMVSFENLKGDIPILIDNLYTIINCNTKLMFVVFLFAGTASLLITRLIIDIMGLNRNDLILMLWERIEELEQKCREATILADEEYPLEEGD